MVLQFDAKCQNVQLTNIHLRTSAAKIPRWRSHIWGSYLLCINGQRVVSLDNITSIIAALASNKLPITITFAHEDTKISLSNVGLPQIYFDQLQVMTAHVNSVKLATKSPADIPKWLTRRMMTMQDNWTNWQAAKWTQLNNYSLQGMFGAPCFAPHDAAIFFFVWACLQSLGKAV